MTHTKGPWHYDSDVNGDRWIVGDTVTWIPRIAKIPRYSGMPNEANARLIAAAPCLLAALEAILPVYEEWTADCGHDPSVGIDCTEDFWRIERARAAIARARGAA